MCASLPMPKTSYTIYLRPGPRKNPSPPPPVDSRTILLRIFQIFVRSTRIMFAKKSFSLSPPLVCPGALSKLVMLLSAEPLDLPVGSDSVQVS